MKKSIITAIFFLAGCPLLHAQTRFTSEEYIDRYKSIAVAHMERYGIPASITLAQGLLESDAGNSALARASNNHFGIKCKNNWTGKRVFHTDDAPDECFRAYPSVEASYEDHARFLDSQPRYDSLFVYSSDDYRSWARGLKAAGYATAPDYAERLCRIIEENQLYLLDRPQGEALYAARNRDRAEQAAGEFIAESSVSSPAPVPTDRVDPDDYRVTINAYKGYNIYETNGVNYIVAKKEDTFESLAEIFRVSARNLRKFNDLKGSAQPVPGEQIYIDRKKKRWEGNARHHIVSEGETVASVAQSYALREKSLRKLNRLNKTAALQSGQRIRIK
ncbi:glucosaminidase domain-containing protein [uncultured Alistipes sp.]|uniref:glucosaminidase domain-containing protein n=1 Tax=uncultured Alistipes sp. TaxID=538949 RepID=UPI002618DD60|nr:glucosaminidase domain-containing protein [uncultured Alistipes sp.]